MAFDVSALADYTNQNSLDLIVKSQLASKTASLLTLQTGVKGPTALQLLNTSLTAQARGCGWTPIGSATFTQRTIVPAKPDFKLPLCPSDLEGKYTVHALTAGAMKEGEVVPFENAITDSLIANIGSIIEKAAWQGDTGSGDENLNKGDGLIKIIDAAADEVLANATPFIGTPIAVATGITKANISSIIDAMILALPSVVAEKSDVMIACSNEDFRKYVQAIKDANLFHHDRTLDGATMELIIPGTNIKLYGLNGLNGTSRLFGFSRSNVVYGVDLENDSEEFSIFYSKDNDEIRFVAKCNYGFQVAYTDEVVSFKLVP